MNSSNCGSADGRRRLSQSTNNVLAAGALTLAGLFFFGMIFSGCVTTQTSGTHYPSDQVEYGSYPEHSHEFERYPKHTHDYAESRRHTHQYDPPPSQREPDFGRYPRHSHEGERFPRHTHDYAESTRHEHAAESHAPHDDNYGRYPRHSHEHERFPRHTHDYAESTRHAHQSETVPGSRPQYGQYPQHSHEHERFPKHHHDLQASTRHTHKNDAPPSHKPDLGPYPRHSHKHERFPRHSHDYAESTRHVHKSETIPGHRPQFGQYPKHTHENERSPIHRHDLAASTRHIHTQPPPASPPPHERHDQTAKVDYKRLKFDKATRRTIENYYFDLAHPDYRDKGDKKKRKSIKKWLKERKRPLSPGLKKNEVLPSNLKRHELPPGLISQLQPPLPETVRVIIAGNIVLLHGPSQIVLSIVKHVARRNKRFPNHRHDLESSTRNTHAQPPPASKPRTAKIDYFKLKFDRETRDIISNYYFDLAHPDYRGEGKERINRVRTWVHKRARLQPFLKRKEVLPPNLKRHALPPGLSAQLPPPLPETVRAVVVGNIVLIHSPTQILLSIVRNVAPRYVGRDGGHERR